MRIFKKIAFLLFIIFIVFTVYSLRATGFFRSIEPQFEGNILAKIPLKGAEDIMISPIDSFVLISATDRVIDPLIEEKGGLFLVDIKANNFQSIPLTNNFNQAFAPHGISFFKKDNTYTVMAINHTNEGHSIEVFELQDKNLKYIKTLKHPSMIQPNDLVMVDENRFYFTNDHKYTKGFGNFVEEYFGLTIANIVYFDGNDYQEVATGIAYANGINYDKRRELLYVASPRHFVVKVYSRKKDGSLSFIEDIPCGTGVDNIEIDEEGSLWIGAHPNLIGFSVYAKGKMEISPSEIIKVIYRGTGDYEVEKVYVEHGEHMSGSSVAATLGNLIFAGSVMDEDVLVLERSNTNFSK